MNYRSAAEAKKTTVFVINCKGEIEETTLYDHVMESADRTTSPRGLMPVIFVEETTIINDDAGDDNEDAWFFEPVWAVKSWKHMNQFSQPTVIADFATKEEAEDAHYTYIYNDDFQKDDQRDTFFFTTREEAEKMLADRLVC